ncbi:MAG: ThuA domain-containing protein [Planctomycetes bacterium]|nr:ThuA domain-containing protein [Planctomycetota bacterium]
MRRLEFMFGGLVMVLSAIELTRGEDGWVVYPGGEGPGKGKHVVLISGDEEYRSEETMPQLGKILSRQHGFRCTVLFAIDPKDGTISPNVNNNIPGLESLKNADLMIIFTRFRDLPDEQMKHVVDYIESGRPVIGLRTATHAFNLSSGRAYPTYSWNHGESKGGFGRVILGETWISHHGNHGSEATRGLIADGQESHPILRGIKSGEIFGPTDVYGVRLPLPDDSLPLVLGQVVAGMKPTDKPVEGPKNSPMMPIAWTKSFKTKDGKTGRAFCTTMGASQDFESAGLRRLLVNATYWAVGLEAKIPSASNVEIVGQFKTSPFKFNGAVLGRKPSDHKLEQ